jgi:hypothetical protein
MIDASASAGLLFSPFSSSTSTTTSSASSTSSTPASASAAGQRSGWPAFARALALACLAPLAWLCETLLKELVLLLLGERALVVITHYFI